MDLSSYSTLFLTLIAFFLVLILPGAAWLLWAHPGRGDVLEWLAEAVASSLSLTALAGMILSLLGLNLTAFSLASLYGILFIGWVVVKLWRGGRVRFRSRPLLMMGALLVLVAWRFYQARTLVMPAWVDSVHHTLLVRLILERGGVPGDWMPYLPVEMYYHFGFHVSAAVFSFFSRIDPAPTLLILGQILNAWVAVAVYRLGKAVFGDTKRAAVAALLVGFVSLMPAYYLTWGRYTLLTGLIVLAAALAAALDVQRAPHSRKAWARLGLYSCGVCFCHFLVVGLLGLFLALMAFFSVIQAFRLRQLKAFLYQPLAAAGLGALVALPWLGRVWYFSAGFFGVSISSPLDPEQAQSAAGLINYLMYLIGPWRGHVLMILAGLGLVLSLRKPAPRVLAGWALGMVWMATPWGPRFSPFRPDHLAIVLFVPAALLAAQVLVSAAEALSRVWRKAAGWIGLALAVGGLLLWGVLESGEIINPVTIFTTPADVSALKWIEKNTPTSARFYINSTLWQMNLYRGVDGGYWITPITGRATLPPPAAYAWGPPQEVEKLAEMMQRATQVKDCSDDFWRLIRENHLTHIYLREQSGNLQPAALVGCADAKPVYQQEGIWIFEVSQNK